jgi:predicted MFS family arabinose efflux permease
LLTDKKTRPKATSAYIFFAALYFIQSVGDPTSGLVSQPVRSLLRSWGESPASLATLMALLAIPWSLKPAFGLLSDFVPLLGSRRRNYLLLANGMAALSLLLLALVPLSQENRWLLFALLLPTTMGIALGDVIVDALMVEKGQPLGLTGRFQSIQWAAANFALLLTGVAGGYIAETKRQSVAFATCAVLWMFAFAVAWRFAGKDRDEHLSGESFRETSAALLGIFRDPLFLGICALLTLWSFNPVWGSVLYLHMTEGLGFSEQSFGNVTSAFFAGSLIGSVGYGIYCRSMRLSTLLHVSILTAIISNAIYWQLSSLNSAYVVSAIAGAAYMTGTLIQLDLTARIIPARAAATVFAAVMALTNFAGSASEAFGGWLFEAGKQAYDQKTAFSLVVLVSVAAAMSCWLVVPVLRRAAPQWWEKWN